jgi:hypothetical protein
MNNGLGQSQNQAVSPAKEIVTYFLKNPLNIIFRPLYRIYSILKVDKTNGNLVSFSPATLCSL